ncbi:MAG: RNA-binding domain-containing protein [Gammaproteobacteria bacterium]
MDGRVEKCLSAKRESKTIEFKESFDPADAGSWCEILKDIIAIANSGGGAIAIGLDSRGKPSGADVGPSLNVDPAVITDKVARVTGHQFTDFEIIESEKEGHRVAVVAIGAVAFPLVFEKAGNYHAADGKQKMAFAKGTVYFRHGAKSEPGNTEDIRTVIERKLESIRKDWVDGVKKVVHAPSGSQVTVLAADVRESASNDATPIRIVDDPNAPAYRRIDYDISHPYRQRDLVAAINKKLPSGVQITAYDVLAVRRTHGIDSKDEYCHHPKFGSAQYSDTFAAWIVSNYEFFLRARQRYYDDTH